MDMMHIIILFTGLATTTVLGQDDTDIANHVVNKVFRGKACSTRKIELRNGRMKLKLGGKMLNYICGRGYTLVGDKYSVCMDGRWSHPTPKCAAPGCPTLKLDLTEGQTVDIIRDQNSGTPIAYTYRCDAPGYHIVSGSNFNQVVCIDYHWFGTNPKCVRVLATVCTFENDTAPDCGWTNGDKHDIDWELHTEETLNEGTGPSYDHTYGQDLKGHYMYVNSYMSDAGEVALFYSPLMDSSSDWCVSLWYHMHGEDADATLAVSTQTEFQRQWDGDFEPLLVLEGDQGNEWKYAQLTIPTQTQHFQILFQATMNSSTGNDIAVDDVITGPCELVMQGEKVITSSFTEEPITEAMSDVNYSTNMMLSSVSVTMMTSPEEDSSIANDSSNETLFQASPHVGDNDSLGSHKPSSNLALIAGTAGTGAFALICLAVIIHLVVRRRRRRRGDGDDSEDLDSQAFAYSPVNSEL